MAVVDQPSRQKPVTASATAERAERGRTARAAVPRSTHGEWTPAADRRDPVELLQEQAAQRVQELLPIRYGRMLSSAFAFYRGAAYVMAADLAGEPRTGLEVQLCGDAHLSNFGAFAAPDRRLIFSLNDFDETLAGPFEWDLKRLVASFAVAARDRGFDAKQRQRITTTVTRAYRAAMHTFAAMGTLELWYARIEVDEVALLGTASVTSKQQKRFEKNLDKTRSKDSLRALAKLTTIVDGEARFRSEPPLITPVEEIIGTDRHAELDAYVRKVLSGYGRTLSSDRRRLLGRFRYVDAARKVVGVGSVGTRAWILLLLGRDGADPLILQFKEAQASVLEPFLGRSEYDHHGRRVVEGQRLTQAASDILLGWVRTPDFDGVPRDFYVRQLWDSKGSALVELMEPNIMELYAQLCGRALAKAHARSGDPVAIAAYLGKSTRLDRALSEFAETYADQNERDHRALAEAVASGRVEAESGV
jgi:uncharacterized protein (DUF2252 family)